MTTARPALCAAAEALEFTELQRLPGTEGHGRDTRPREGAGAGHTGADAAERPVDPALRSCLFLRCSERVRFLCRLTKPVLCREHPGLEVIIHPPVRPTSSCGLGSPCLSLGSAVSGVVVELASGSWPGRTAMTGDPGPSASAVVGSIAPDCARHKTRGPQSVQAGGTQHRGHVPVLTLEGQGSACNRVRGQRVTRSGLPVS